MTLSVMTHEEPRLPKYHSSCSICLPLAHAACRFIHYLALGVIICVICGLSVNIVQSTNMFCPILLDPCRSVICDDLIRFLSCL